ncbi:hypothetical protein D3C76_1043620 [compost metagenome]
MLIQLGLIAGERIGHGVRRQVEGVGRIARPFTHITRACTYTQLVATEQAAEVVNSRQRTTVFGNVLQAVALKVRVFCNLGIGKGIAADQAPVVAELAGQVKLHTS